MNLRENFLRYCETKEFEINDHQLNIIEDLKNFYKRNFRQTFLTKIFNKKETKMGYYLVGDVGVGKTMILNFFF